ncbi:hypothetical protein OHR86_15005 [Streptomyces sp. NBC_00441]|uniref:hypothetical protein n=1 Tax=Streptomyces sp. NBC_00441 TaxID=2975742 RepID=UPI0030E3663C
MSGFPPPALEDALAGGELADAVTGGRAVSGASRTPGLDDEVVPFEQRLAALRTA